MLEFELENSYIEKDTYDDKFTKKGQNEHLVVYLLFEIFLMHYYGKSCILTNAMKKYRLFFKKMQILRKKAKKSI